MSRVLCESFASSSEKNYTGGSLAVSTPGPAARKQEQPRVKRSCFPLKSRSSGLIPIHLIPPLLDQRIGVILAGHAESDGDCKAESDSENVDQVLE